MKVDLTSSPSYVANMQVKQYVPGFLVVTNPSSSVKKLEKNLLLFLHKKNFLFSQKRFYMVHSMCGVGVTVPQVNGLFR